MGVLGLTPFLQKSFPEVVKQLPDRLRGLAGKKIVIDGTLITQRLHFAQVPHPYRHILGWYRIIKELEEAGVSGICVFDGKERSLAKAREAERRREVQRLAVARGSIELARVKRLNRLVDVLDHFQKLDVVQKGRVSELLQRISWEQDLLSPPATSKIAPGPEPTLDALDTALWPVDITQVPEELVPLHDTSVQQPLSQEDLKTAAGPEPTRDALPQLPPDNVTQVPDELMTPYDTSAQQPLSQEESIEIPDAVSTSPAAPSEKQPSKSTSTYNNAESLEPHLLPLPTTTASPSALSTPVSLPPTSSPSVQSTPPSPPSPASSPLASSSPPPASSAPRASRSSPALTSSTATPTFPPLDRPFPCTPIPQTPDTADNEAPPPNPDTTLDTLSSLYFDFRDSVRQLASLTPAASDVREPSTDDEQQEARVEYSMTKSQIQLTADEAKLWEEVVSPASDSDSPESQSPNETLSALAYRAELMLESYRRRTSPPTTQTYDESKELLRAMGIPCMDTTGTYEAEALASSMVIKGVADYVASEDTDVVIYEAPLIRNITSRNHPLIILSGSEIRAALQLDRSSFIDFALLLGTDFSQRIKNVGPTRALKFIQQHKTIERVVEAEKKFTPRIPALAYLAEVEVARLVFQTLPPVPDAKLLEQKRDDEELMVILQRFGLGKLLMNEDYDFGEALRGNYFSDNPTA
ncbi:PIN domain-like protein [Mycena epipterygia]|nr:PIN domain-like protein [Mycena epipterygia]